jgi:hypothetical protein
MCRIDLLTFTILACCIWLPKISRAQAQEAPFPLPPVSDQLEPLPTSAGYKAPGPSLKTLFESDEKLKNAIMKYAATGNAEAYRKFIETEASAGNVGAELLLGSMYIPEQCTFQPNRDAPHCGEDGNEKPNFSFRANSLGIPPSYEEAAHWLDRASAQGSGEASERLAQLITRMLANRHDTTYTIADSTRLHALARTQGYDAEPLTVTCYRLTKSRESNLKVLNEPDPQNRAQPLYGKWPPNLSSSQLSALKAAGTQGTLTWAGGSGVGNGDSLGERAEGPQTNVAMIIDHSPSHEIHLPLPARHDAIYVQRGDDFVLLPPGTPTLPRIISVMPNPAETGRVSIYAQNADATFSGGCSSVF